jgi:hypothetical protein
MVEKKMKLTKKYLEQIIKEECAAMLPNGMPGGFEDEIVDDGEEPEHEETDIEGLAHRAIAAIYDLATAAGANISIDAGTDDSGSDDIEGEEA